MVVVWDLRNVSTVTMAIHPATKMIGTNGVEDVRVVTAFGAS